MSSMEIGDTSAPSFSYTFHTLSLSNELIDF